ncbi:Ig domain-containing protein [Streptomyces sp. NRRL F-4489]|uniref:Ig domain-containing protein n=1 Tax=Streptomyces sp. NRRL F-4489 TaxID=1609095 RepID=UPI00074AFC09|nr:Ig domain-containing protein [Streptomyces sp. NRRL F-4489]KUL35592.1 Ig domain-containing protein [Streptomyces sp. NRRL F-4489]
MSAEAGHGRAYTIQPAGSTGQRACPHEVFPYPLKVRVVDEDQSPVAGVPVTFTWDAMGEQALFDGVDTTVTVLTDPEGYAETPTLVAGDAAGTAAFTVTAADAPPLKVEVAVAH